MTPSEFLSLVRGGADAARAAGASASARAYRAWAEGGNETFLTLHTSGGRFECPAYAQLFYISGDDRGGTSLRLIFTKISVVLSGRQLGSVFEGIRSRKAAHVFEFDGGRYDPPEPGQPVVLGIAFAAERPKGASQDAA